MRYSNAERVLFKIENYELMKLGLLTSLTASNLSIDKTDLEKTLDELQTIQQTIMTDSTNVGSQQQELFDSAVIILSNS